MDEPIHDPVSTVQAIARAQVLTPRPCVGCRTIGLDECAACYAQLYPRPDSNQPQTSEVP